MAITISNVYVQSFEENIRHLAQQGDTKLRAYVTEKSVTSEKHNWERLGSLAATEKTTTRQATPASDPAWSRRVSTAETWNLGTTTEQEDIVQMLVDPNSAQASAIAMGMKRAVDDIIIEAATGDSVDGTGGAVVFPAGQIIGNGAAAISVALVTQVSELFYENDVDPDEPKVMVISPVQLRQLLNITEVTSSDYQTLKALASGKMPDWMGFTWIVSNRLTVPAAGQLYCLAFTKKALGLQMNRDITVRVAEDPSISFAWRIYSFMTMGCIRVEDEHIVALHVLNS